MDGAPSSCSLLLASVSLCTHVCDGPSVAGVTLASLRLFGTLLRAAVRMQAVGDAALARPAVLLAHGRLRRGVADFLLGVLATSERASRFSWLACSRAVQLLLLLVDSDQPCTAGSAPPALPYLLPPDGEGRPLSACLLASFLRDERVGKGLMATVSTLALGAASAVASSGGSIGSTPSLLTIDYGYALACAANGSGELPLADGGDVEVLVSMTVGAVTLLSRILDRAQGGAGAVPGAALLLDYSPLGVGSGGNGIHLLLSYTGFREDVVGCVGGETSGLLSYLPPFAPPGHIVAASTDSFSLSSTAVACLSAASRCLSAAARAGPPRLPGGGGGGGAAGGGDREALAAWVARHAFLSTLTESEVDLAVGRLLPVAAPAPGVPSAAFLLGVFQLAITALDGQPGLFTALVNDAVPMEGSRVRTGPRSQRADGSPLKHVRFQGVSTSTSESLSNPSPTNSDPSSELAVFKGGDSSLPGFAAFNPSVVEAALCVVMEAPRLMRLTPDNGDGDVGEGVVGCRLVAAALALLLAVWRSACERGLYGGHVRRLREVPDFWKSVVRLLDAQDLLQGFALSGTGFSPLPLSVGELAGEIERSGTPSGCGLLAARLDTALRHAGCLAVMAAAAELASAELLWMGSSSSTSHELHVWRARRARVSVDGAGVTPGGKEELDAPVHTGVHALFDALNTLLFSSTPQAVADPSHPEQDESGARVPLLSLLDAVANSQIDAVDAAAAVVAAARSDALGAGVALSVHRRSVVPPTPRIASFQAPNMLSPSATAALEQGGCSVADATASSSGPYGRNFVFRGDTLAVELGRGCEWAHAVGGACSPGGGRVSLGATAATDADAFSSARELRLLWAIAVWNSASSVLEAQGTALASVQGLLCVSSSVRYLSVGGPVPASPGLLPACGLYLLRCLGASVASDTDGAGVGGEDAASLSLLRCRVLTMLAEAATLLLSPSHGTTPSFSSTAMRAAVLSVVAEVLSAVDGFLLPQAAYQLSRLRLLLCSLALTGVQHPLRASSTDSLPEHLLAAQSRLLPYACSCLRACVTSGNGMDEELKSELFCTSARLLASLLQGGVGGSQGVEAEEELVRGALHIAEGAFAASASHLVSLFSTHNDAWLRHLESLLPPPSKGGAPPAPPSLLRGTHPRPGVDGETTSPGALESLRRLRTEDALLPPAVSGVVARHEKIVADAVALGAACLSRPYAATLLLTSGFLPSVVRSPLFSFMQRVLAARTAAGLDTYPLSGRTGGGRTPPGPPHPVGAGVAKHCRGGG